MINENIIGSKQTIGLLKKGDKKEERGSIVSFSEENNDSSRKDD